MIRYFVSAMADGEFFSFFSDFGYVIGECYWTQFENDVRNCIAQETGCYPDKLVILAFQEANK